MTYYDRWLGLWDEANRERERSRRVIHEDELVWEETPQDAKSALLVAKETGFRTWGSETILSEIPVGWSTGLHSHGEEAIYVVTGEGSSLVDGRLYDWGPGSVLGIPFGAEHQHFNRGDVPVRYMSAMSVGLEHLVGMHRTIQLAKAGAYASLPEAPKGADGFAEDGSTRIVLRPDEAEVVNQETTSAAIKKVGHSTDEAVVYGRNEPAGSYTHAHHMEFRNFMSVKTQLNQFGAREQEISGIMSDAPHTHGGKHGHMEAHIYIVSGYGYSIIDEEKVPWRTGSTLHIPGPQTVHQHFNESDEPSRMLRVAPGLRYFFETFAAKVFPKLHFETRELIA